MQPKMGQAATTASAETSAWPAETPVADLFPTRALVRGMLPGLIGLAIAGLLFLYLQPRAMSQIAAVRGDEIFIVRADKASSVTMAYPGYTFSNMSSGNMFGLQWSPTGYYLSTIATNSTEGTIDTLITPSTAFSKNPLADTLVITRALLLNRAWSRDGGTVAMASSDLERPGIRLYDYAQSKLITTTELLDYQAPVDWHPTQSRLIYTTIAKNGLTRTLQMIEPTGARAEFIPADLQASRSSAAWAPEGTRVAYIAQPTVTLSMTTDRPLIGDLWMAQVDGSKALKLTTSGNYLAASWSPDGNRLFAISVITSSNPLVYLLETVRITDTLTTQLSQIAEPAFLGIGGADRLWQWSPTGKHFLFVSVNEKRQPIVVMTDADGNGGRIAYVHTKGGVMSADWMPTGSAILVSSPGEQMQRLWVDPIVRPGDQWPVGMYANWQP